MQVHLRGAATAAERIDGDTLLASTPEETAAHPSTTDAGPTSVSVTHTYHVSELGRIDFASQLPPGGTFVRSLT